MPWQNISEYLRIPLTTLNRFLAPIGGRSLEQQAAFERSKAELAAAISIRQADPSALISLGRRGFSSDFRFWAWEHILGSKELTEEDFENLFKDAFGAAASSTFALKAPLFGSSVNLNPLQLTERESLDFIKVLCLISHRNPHLEFIPLFPPIAAILVTIYPAHKTFACLEAIIRGGSVGASESKEWPFFPQNRRETLIFSRVFDELLLKFVPNIPRHVLKLQRDEPGFNPRWTCLLSDFFIGLLPLHYNLKIFDSYTVEGFKVIMRYALAHVALQQDLLLESRTTAEFLQILFDAFNPNVFPTDPYNYKLFQKTAFSFKFSRSILIRFKNRHRKLSLEDFDAGDRAVILQKPMPKLSRPSSFLTNQDWEHIWSWIPARFRIFDPELLFISAEHGHRLATLFEKAGECEPLLLIIETTDGNIFGAYLSRSLRNRSARKFFGTGETFIFNLRPTPQYYPWNEAFNNQQYIYADENFLAIGCSSGKFGIWIDRDLNQVVSSHCDTFNNPSLIDNEPGWSDIYCIEAYRLKLK